MSAISRRERMHAGSERERPEWRTWLAVLAEARRAMADPIWSRAVPASTGSAEADAREATAPLLDGAVIRLDVAAAERFLRRVFTVAASAGAVAAPLNAVARMHRLDTLALVQATLTRSARALDGWANEMDVLPATLSAVMGVAVTPLLQAVRRAWADRVPVGWGHGYCPVCGEWVALAEALDLDHSRRLRCGECGSDWRGAWLRCAFCANTDHTTLALFTPDAALATRSIETCAVCGGYVKVLATLQAAAPEAVALLDLATVELDIVAVEQGYARPRAPASVLHVSVVPARR